MTLSTIPPPPGQQIDIGPLSIHYYGVLIGIGALLAIAMGRRRYAALGGDPDLIDRVGVVAVLAGLLGARGAYVMTHFDQLVDRPWAALFIWEGGLAFFGGLTIGVVVGVWYARRLGMPLTATLDALVPGIPLAQAIGRWGNYFNQELYGTPTTLPWALEVEVADGPPLLVHPTFLYESLLNLCLVAVLLWMGRRNLRQGSIVWAYFAGYGFIRFWVELLRVDTPHNLLGLSRNNWVALLVFLVGLVGLAWWQRRGPDRPIGTPIDDAGAVEGDTAPTDATATAAGGTTGHADTAATDGPSDEQEASTSTTS